MMGSSLGAWSRLLPGKPQQRTPATDLVTSLIGIEERRAERERLKRAEERMNREQEIRAEALRQAEEWKKYEAQKELDARTRRDEIVTKEVMKNLGNIEMEPEPQVPAERLKATRKVGPDGSVTESIDQPLDIDPATGRDVQALAPVDLRQLTALDLGGGPQTPGAPEVLPMMQREIQQVKQRRSDLPETRTGPMGEYAPEYLEDALVRRRAEALAGPAGVQAELYSGMRETPEERLARELAIIDARRRDPEEIKAEARAKFEAEKEVFGPRRTAESEEKWGFYTDQETGDISYLPESKIRANPNKYRRSSVADTKRDKRGASVVGIFGGPNDPNPATLWNAAMAMNKGKTGGLGRVGGAVGTAYRTFMGEEPITRNYQKQIAGFASMIAKEFGEAGRLSDQDIQRTVNLFPTPSDTEQETKIALENIWRVISYGQGISERPTDVLGPLDNSHTFSLLKEPPAPEGFTEPVGE